MTTSPQPLELDSSPFPAWQFWGLIVLALLGYMFGPAITAFFGMATPRRRGARFLCIFGFSLLLLHLLLFIAALAAPSWYPALYEMYPSLPEPRISGG